jgi:hypothetical protein
MSLFLKLKDSQGMKMLCGFTVRIGDPAGGTCDFAVEAARLDRDPDSRDQVLAAMHYYSHVLARFPRSESDLDRYGMDLREMVSQILEQGIWPGSNLLRYAGVSDQARLVEPGTLASGRDVAAVLYRSTLADDLDLALDVPENVGHEELVLSVPVFLQGLTGILGEPELELLDKALRYFRVYVGEGADYGSPVAARTLANRSFREAAGEAG